MLFSSTFFAAVAVSLVSAGLLGHQLWAWPALLLLLARVAYLRQPRVLLFVVALSLAMAGRCALQLRQVHLQTATSEQTGTYAVRVLPDQWRIQGNLAQATGKVNGQPVRLSWRLSSAEQLRGLESLEQPAVVTIRGKLSPLTPATNFNQFDYQAYSQHRGIYNQVRGNGEVRAVPATSPLEVIHGWRAQLGHRFDRLPQPLGGFCRQLLLGQSDPELALTISDAKQLGVIHLFCLSGLHVVVFLGLLRGLLLRLHITKERTLTIEILCLPLLWVLGGGATSLTRAVMMMELQLLAKRAGYSNPVSWNLSLLIHSFLVPGVLLSLGGQLSYLLALALRYGNFKNAGQQLVAIQLIGLPALLHATFQVHLLTLLANWLLVPLFAAVILPAVLVGGLAGPWLPPVANLINAGLVVLQTGLSWLADRPGLIVFGRLGAVVAVVLTVLTLVIVERPARLKRHWPLLAVSYLACYAVIHLPLSGEVTFVDIGQGDCAIIRTPLNRQVIMVDTGGQLQFAPPEWAKRTPQTTDRAMSTSVNYLKSKGIAKIDWLYLTHSDADHIGYAPTIFKQFQVQRVVVPKGMEQLEKFTRQVPAGVEIIPATDQQPPADTPLRVLHPFEAGKGTNEDSLVLAGSFGRQSFVLTGDLDQAGEKAVLERYPDLRASVAKLGHHGSKTSTAPEFLRQVAPRLTIISAGRQNRYGHPSQETIATLKQLQIPTYSTQQYGMIRYRYWGKFERIETKLKGSELLWTLPPYARN